MKSEDPRIRQAACGGFFGGLGHRSFRQPGEFVLVVDYHGKLIGGVEQIAVELYEKFRQLVVDSDQFLLFVGRESCALFGEFTVIFLYKYTLLIRWKS